MHLVLTIEANEAASEQEDLRRVAAEFKNFGTVSIRSRTHDSIDSGQALWLAVIVSVSAAVAPLIGPLTAWLQGKAGRKVRVKFTDGSEIEAPDLATLKEALALVQQHETQQKGSADAA